MPLFISVVVFLLPPVLADESKTVMSPEDADYDEDLLDTEPDDESPQYIQQRLGGGVVSLG